MKSNFLIQGIILATMLAGCNRSQVSNHQIPLLQATTWYQHSAEMKAICYQTFTLAQMELDRRLTYLEEKPPAVVLDIDESVLDNSPQTGQQILDNQGFTNDMWDEWCRLAVAKAVPGSLKFTLYAKEAGVEVFYISNRAIHLLGPTIKNMNELGFPNADSLHILLKTVDSNKDSRRERVKEGHEVLIMIGDNLGDFSSIFDDRSHGMAHRKVDEHCDSFGTKFFVLPNPMYGGWEKSFRGETEEETSRIKIEALKSYK